MSFTLSTKEIFCRFDSSCLVKVIFVTLYDRIFDGLFKLFLDISHQNWC